MLHKDQKRLKSKNLMLGLFGALNFKLSAPSFQLPTSVFGLLTIIFFSSCTQKTFNNESELLEYIKTPENGYTQHKTINGVDYTLMYHPTDMLVKQELGDSVNGNKINALRNKYNKYLYFNLSMSKNNQELLSVAPKNRNEFGAMVNQLAFGMNEKVHVYTPSKDTLEMADFIYPRMYGMSRATTIMFVYPRDNEALKQEYLNFTIEDLGLYTGEVKFKIPIEKIKKEPMLKFN
ncbi:hypothetical protein [Flavivirga sp. 57AJ16]|uniref:hypothetical protein n=1 Tax=Flavivirga sp. 57AJ16 TaxID=3025307 RepID=UPI002365849E|nr:hypothetical protein [Flavivirga sp. 57AJ16]MDD7886032.1 hypothetical protein [Flavivirga sp. 57AJ16]